MNPKTTEPCFVVLRTDEAWENLRGVTHPEEVTVKLVAWTAEDANEHVERLNRLNQDKGCRYHWVTSRALRREKV